MPQHTATEAAVSYGTGVTGLSGGIVTFTNGVEWGAILIVASTFTITARFVFDVCRFYWDYRDRVKARKKGNYNE